MKRKSELCVARTGPSIGQGQDILVKGKFELYVAKKSFADNHANAVDRRFNFFILRV